MWIHANIELCFSDEEETTDYWFDSADGELTQALQNEDLNANTARNVIMFLGKSVLATRYIHLVET